MSKLRYATEPVSCGYGALRLGATDRAAVAFSARKDRVRYWSSERTIVTGIQLAVPVLSALAIMTVRSVVRTTANIERSTAPGQNCGALLQTDLRALDASGRTMLGSCLRRRTHAPI